MYLVHLLFYDETDTPVSLHYPLSSTERKKIRRVLHRPEEDCSCSHSMCRVCAGRLVHSGTLFYLGSQKMAEEESEYYQHEIVPYSYIRPLIHELSEN